VPIEDIARRDIGARIVERCIDFPPQNLQAFGTTGFVVLKQAETCPDDLAGILKAAILHLPLDKILEMRA
jgi:hypothetical protein